MQYSVHHTCTRMESCTRQKLSYEAWHIRPDKQQLQNRHSSAEHKLPTGRSWFQTDWLQIKLSSTELLTHWGLAMSAQAVWAIQILSFEQSATKQDQWSDNQLMRIRSVVYRHVCDCVKSTFPTTSPWALQYQLDKTIGRCQADMCRYLHSTTTI